MLVVIVSLKSLTVHMLGRINGQVWPSLGLPELPPSGALSSPSPSSPSSSPLLPHHPHPHLLLALLPYLPLHHNFPLCHQKNRRTFPSLMTRKSPPWAHDLIGRLCHSPLPHGLTTIHSSLLYHLTSIHLQVTE